MEQLGTATDSLDAFMATLSGPVAGNRHECLSFSVPYSRNGSACELDPVAQSHDIQQQPRRSPCLKAEPGSPTKTGLVSDGHEIEHLGASEKNGLHQSAGSWPSAAEPSFSGTGNGTPGTSPRHEPAKRQRHWGAASRTAHLADRTRQVQALQPRSEPCLSSLPASSRPDNADTVSVPASSDTEDNDAASGSMQVEGVTADRRHRTVSEAPGVLVRDLEQPHRLLGVSLLHNWEQTGLPTTILDWLKDGLGMGHPTLVQRACIPVLVRGHHCVGVAETGSGKTLAYLVPLLRYLIRSWRDRGRRRTCPVAVIITPTRELAMQVHKLLVTLLQHLSWPSCSALEPERYAADASLRASVADPDIAVPAMPESWCLCAYGGADLAANVATLCRGVRVLIGTPGRLISLLQLNRGRFLHLRGTALLVLDEVDRLLDLGFAPQIQRILAATSTQVQMAFFSATLPPIMEKLIRKLISQQRQAAIASDGSHHQRYRARRRLVLIRCTTRPLTMPQSPGSAYEPGIPLTIQQRVHVLPETDPPQAVEQGEAARFAALLDLLDRHTTARMLVFVSRQEQVDLLFQRLVEWHRQEKQQASKRAPALRRAANEAIEHMLALHGGIDQGDRDDTWDLFRHPLKRSADAGSHASCRLLLATSLAARGLDVPDLDVVVNFHAPRSLEDYVHRVGRTGRANRLGVAYTLFVPHQDDFAAPFLVQCLEAAGQEVPSALATARERWMGTKRPRFARQGAQMPMIECGATRSHVAAPAATRRTIEESRETRSVSGDVASYPPMSPVEASCPATRHVGRSPKTDDLPAASFDGDGAQTVSHASSSMQGCGYSTGLASAAPQQQQQQQQQQQSIPSASGHRCRRVEWRPPEYRGRGFTFDTRDLERLRRRLVPATTTDSILLGAGADSSLVEQHQLEACSAKDAVLWADECTAILVINGYPGTVRQRVTSSAFLRHIFEKHGCRVLVKGAYQRNLPERRSRATFHAMPEIQRPLYLWFEAPTTAALQGALQHAQHELASDKSIEETMF